MSKAILIYDPDSEAHVRVYADAMAREFPALPVYATHERAAAVGYAPRATAIIAKAQDVLPELIAAMPAIDWIQATTTGVDPLHALKLPASVAITSTRGMHAPQMAELALLLMLSL